MQEEINNLPDGNPKWALQEAHRLTWGPFTDAIKARWAELGTDFEGGVNAAIPLELLGSICALVLDSFVSAARQSEIPEGHIREGLHHWEDMVHAMLEASLGQKSSLDDIDINALIKKVMNEKHSQ